MIEVSSLTKVYGALRAVDDLSFAVQPGEVLGLLGQNGAGKTTTLRCLAGVIPPTSGAIRIAGRDLRAEPLEAKRRLAFLSDEPRLFEHLTVRQHLDFAARLYQVADAPARIPALLAELELTDKAGVLPAELSRGMKQKVGVACGLLHEPAAMFFDEPLTGLDPIAIRRTKRLITARAAAGAAIILSSHLLHLVEEICTHVLVLRSGRRVAHGTLAEVRAAHAGAEGDSLEDAFLRLAGEDAAAPA